MTDCKTTDCETADCETTDCEMTDCEMTDCEQIKNELFNMRDESYRDFQASLIPETDAGKMIGVRTPNLRAYAKELLKSGEHAEFIASLPHKYFDEMQLHSFIISEFKDFEECMKEVERFLPHVDNWATCDQLSPKVFGKKKEGRLVYGSRLLDSIDAWLKSDLTYTIRFGIKMLMQHYLDEDFDISYMDRIAGIRSEEYYINMMTAWYFATALAKRWDEALAVLNENRLDKWTHNKAIQKAIESRRISDGQKQQLRTLKRR